jgi:hypothetical protein
MSTPRQTLCPSARPDWEGSKVIGVVGGTAETPEVAYLTEAQPVTDELLALARPVAPTEVFRIAAPCACSGCGHFSPEQAKCKLAEKIVRWAPVVVDKLPACTIRPDCKWWQQEGRAACMRCPQVVTDRLQAPEALEKAGDLTVD